MHVWCCDMMFFCMDLFVCLFRHCFSSYLLAFSICCSWMAPSVIGFVVVDHFYIALFSALKQAHCTRMFCGWHLYRMYHYHQLCYLYSPFACLTLLKLVLIIETSLFCTVCTIVISVTFSCCLLCLNFPVACNAEYIHCQNSFLFAKCKWYLLFVLHVCLL